MPENAYSPFSPSTDESCVSRCSDHIELIFVFDGIVDDDSFGSRVALAIAWINPSHRRRSKHECPSSYFTRHASSDFIFFSHFIAVNCASHLFRCFVLFSISCFLFTWAIISLIQWDAERERKKGEKNKFGAHNVRWHLGSYLRSASCFIRCNL